MKTTGTGSRLSPIAIDDSEDEVLQELVGEAHFESSSSPIDTVTDQRGKVPRNGAPNAPSAGHRQNMGFEGKPPQKRKRVPHESGPIAGSSHQRLDSIDHTSPPLSKKAKKRRRKVERMVQEYESHPPRQPQTWMNGANFLIPELAAPQMLPSWGTFGAGSNKSPSPYMAYNATNYALPQHSPEIPASSSSSWVASMAMAAEAPVPNGRGPDSWEPYPHTSTWPNSSQRSGHGVLPFPESLAIPVPTPVPPPAPPPAPVAPAPPPPLQSIGMKPDHDPSSKHGLFVIPPGASKGAKDDSSSQETPYIPNPARTLVMEQLPKSHRTQDFVNGWSKTACGAYPVFLCIDSHGAKALVEFATAELARKAWSSPRLGTSLVGVKTHHLKGRPREDLIKVWWYRVDGIGANAGVGEIEEGEIEGDAAEKEIEVPVKKETKKEKKARLFRERQAKQALTAVKSPNISVEPTSPATSVVSEVPVPKEIVTPPPFTLPPNPTVYPNIEHNNRYSYYPIIPQPLPRPLPLHFPAPVHLPHPPPRAPLLPQSALETQWRHKHELPLKPTRETITSAPASWFNHTAPSIAPSRSPSPVQHVPRIPQAVQSPSNPPFSPVYEDMDVDVDMDLESPLTGRRTTFDLSSIPSVPDNAPSGAPPSPSFTTELTSIPIPGSMTYTVTSSPSFDSTRARPDNNGHDTTPSLPLHEPAPIHATLPPPAAGTSPPLSASGTPPLEPRAMKNAPKGPSYAKRSLVARQKELEERIARSKMELGIVTAPVPHATNSPPVVPMTEFPVAEDEESNKTAMEERLRSLVLRSQRNKSRSSLPVTPSTEVLVPPSISPVPSGSPISLEEAGIVEPDPSASVSPASSLETQTFSLEDLAVSFITEAIETFKATPHPPAPVSASAPAPTLLPTPAANQTSKSALAVKLELAAKQKRLEAQIAESKVLMEKLTKARTKNERESILAAMREQSRSASMLENDNSSTIATAPQIPVQAAPRTNTQPFAVAGSALQRHTALAIKKWPGSHEHAGVLIVSDDEGDDDSDCDD